LPLGPSIVAPVSQRPAKTGCAALEPRYSPWPAGISARGDTRLQVREAVDSVPEGGSRQDICAVPGGSRGEEALRGEGRAVSPG